MVTDQEFRDALDIDLKNDDFLVKIVREIHGVRKRTKAMFTGTIATPRRLLQQQIA